MFYKREDIKSKSKYNTIAETELKENACEVILRGIEQKPHKNYGWDHNVYCKFTTGDRTEKRWCRCLVNYSDEQKKKDCDNCVLKNDYAKPVKNAKFTDFEVPVSSDGKDKIGEIDVILEYEGIEYCTEVKPEWNGESLLRMIAEIITYCYVSGDNMKNKAIMFKKDSEQYFQWTGKKGAKPYIHAARKRIKEIIEENKIAVFCLEDEGDFYELKKLN